MRPAYLVVERSPALTREEVDALAAEASAHGWTPLFADRYPYAGGPRHYAAHLTNTDGFEVELVAAVRP